MKIKTLLLILLSPILLLSLKCRKDKLPEVELPVETQTGANTFGCKINGEIWLPKGALFTTPAYDVQYYKSNGTLLIKTNRSDVGQSLNIYLYDIFQAADYIILSPPNNVYRYRNDHFSCQLYESANSIETGVVTITRVDTINKIVSGRFYGVLYQSGCPDINITEGRFDFKMTVFN